MCYNVAMGRVMALDIGDVRIGIAVSDIMQIIANPIESYTRCKNNTPQDISYIAAMVAEREVDTIVSGLPLGMSGMETQQTQKVRDFCELLTEAVGLPIVFVDERLTTVSAERVLLQGNVSRANRKKVVDKLAATIILQSYLDGSRGTTIY